MDDLAALAPLVAHGDRRVQLLAATALTRRPGDDRGAEKWAALTCGLAVRPIALPSELLDAIASHGSAVAAATLRDLAIEFPGKRAIWETWARIDPPQALAAVLRLAPERISAIDASLRAGPLADALAASPMPEEARHVIEHLPETGSMEDVVQRFGDAIAGHALLVAFTAQPHRYFPFGDLVARWSGRAGIDALIEAAANPLREVRDHAVASLCSLGGSLDRERHRIVDTLIGRGTEEGIDSALDFLERSRAEGFASELRRVMRMDVGNGRRARALLLLARVEREAAQRDVLAFTSSSSLALRRAAAVALSSVPTAASELALSELVRDQDRRVSDAALESLLELAEASEEFGSLVELLGALRGEMLTRATSAVERRLPSLGASRTGFAPSDGGGQRFFNREISDAARAQLDRLRKATRTPPVEALDRGIPDSPPLESSDPETLGDGPAALADAYFTAIAPDRVVSGQAFLIEIWCHAEEPRHFVSDIAAGRRAGFAGPVEVRSGAVLTVTLSMPGFAIEEDSGPLMWRNRSGVLSFELRASPGLATGIHAGRARVTLAGLTIATIRFLIELAEAPGRQVRVDRTASVRKVRTAFASYASEDRAQVLARIQGMQKVLPALDIFLDVLSLRSGEAWQQRIDEAIAERDVLFLFWSRAARQSAWVDYEWRTALALHGLDAIDPVPLETPVLAPVPEGLASLHFNDWTLQFNGAS